MPEKKKVLRLAQAATKFNVSRERILDFLAEKSFSLDSKPSAKLSDEMIEALEMEFFSDVATKKEAGKVEIGGQTRTDVEISEITTTAKRKKEEEMILIRTAGTETPIEVKPEEKAPEKEEIEEEVVEVEKVELSGPKVVGKVELEKEEEVVEEVKEDEKPESKSKKKTKEEEPEEFIETQKVKLTGPKVIDKIEIPDKKEEEAKKRKRNAQRVERVNLDGKEGSQRKRRRIVRNKGEEPKPISKEEIQKRLQATKQKIVGGNRGKSDRSKIRKKRKEERAKQQDETLETQESRTIEVTEFITVNDLASMMDVQPTDIIMKCMELGHMVTITQRLDAEVIDIICAEYDFEVKFIDEEESFDREEIIDKEEDLKARPPIVTIMGHVDHGKTSLLDYIRKANVVDGESGGITQHIGAYEVKVGKEKSITFLDTPGHEAFTAMRARGAKVTDIAVIIIAADDAIMPQTEEAISHAQAAEVPMVFAINKMDVPGANPEKIKEQLAQKNILVEDWGGDYQCQHVSAKSGEGIAELLEKITIQAELLELKANPNRVAEGTVIEASLDKGRGYVATLLVQKGTIKVGDILVAGHHFGRVKAMFNERGQKKSEAGPSAPVQILGLDGAPTAGDTFDEFESEQEAKGIAAKRGQIVREQGFRTKKHITLDEIGRRLKLGSFKELNMVIKGDVDGSVQALTDSFQKLSTESVVVNVVHAGVGQISENDVLLAAASDALIIGFNIRPSVDARRKAEEESIEIRTYSVIYKAIEEVKAAMEGLLEPDIEEKVLFTAQVLETFKISKIGTIAGCRVIDGKAVRDAQVRILREGTIIYTGEIASLKRFKDDVKEVPNGQECGMSIKGYNDVKVGDEFEGYTEISIKRTL